MRIEKTGYDWEAWFKAAFEKQKIENMNLTGRLLDAEERRNEAKAKFDRIVSSGPYKLYRKFKKDDERSVSDKQDGKAADKAYTDELARQKDPYSAWIAFNEHKNMKDTSDTEKVKSSFLLKSYSELAEIIRLGSPVENDILAAEEPSLLDERAHVLAASFFASDKKEGIWYADEDEVDEDGKRMNPWFKPEWSPESLYGFFFPGSFFAIRKKCLNAAIELLKANGLVAVNDNADARGLVYLVMLAAAEETAGTHTAEVLCHTKATKKVADTGTEGKELLETTVSPDYSERGSFWGYENKYALIKKHFAEKIHGVKAEIFDTLRDDVYTVCEIPEGDHLVSVIIPSKDHPQLLSELLESFVTKTAFKDVEFIIVDNGSSDENKRDIERIIARMSEKYRVHADYLYRKEEFNFSRMCSRGVSKAKGDLLLFLNDDTEVIEEDWLTIMVCEALREGVGAVGASLRYPDDLRFQHAGITNLKVGPAHKLITFPDDRMYYFGAGAVPQNVCAVTGACLLVKKSAYEKSGGFDESFPVEYNDVDLCFSLLDAGFRNVIRNDAVLIHKESISRGRSDNDGEKSGLLIKEQDRLYHKHPAFADGRDPYYSPMLTQDSPEYYADMVFDYAVPGKLSEKTDVDAAKGSVCSDSELVMNVERAGLQLKRRDAREDIIRVEGWSYLKGADNSIFTGAARRMYFKKTDPDAAPVYYSISDRYRYDVEKVMDREKNVALAGFVCRVKRSDLEAGEYLIGMEYICGDKIYRSSNEERLQIGIQTGSGKDSKA